METVEKYAQMAETVAVDKSREIAMNLKKEGMDLDFIVKVVNIARDVVEKWLEEHHD